MAVYKLKNEAIEIQINSCGAELRSLKRLDTGIEYMWQADPKFWGRTSPILFPFVGGLKGGIYRIGDKTYSMPKHGFSRDMEFEVLSQTESEIWFQLKPTEDTLKIYPYEFVLKQGYQLLPDGVKVLWQVGNPGNEELYFSIGGHPAFNCPLDPEKKQTDYKIYFGGKDEIISTKISANGLATDEKDHYPLKDGLLSITENLFDHDALVIENNQTNVVAFCDKAGKPYVTVTMDVPLFGIWSPDHKNAPFICIEPWCGRCDHEDFEGELKDRQWGNSLAPGGVWNKEYTIQV